MFEIGRDVHSTINNQQSTINNQRTTINEQQSTNNNQQSTINNQQSTINNQRTSEQLNRKQAYTFKPNIVISSSWSLPSIQRKNASSIKLF